MIVATAAVDKHKQLKDVAQFIKHEMDHKFPATKATEGVYHCAVGKSFASEFARLPKLPASFLLSIAACRWRPGQM